MGKDRGVGIWDLGALYVRYVCKRLYLMYVVFRLIIDCDFLAVYEIGNRDVV